ncbi:hypothetical protein M0L20_29550 [Spirosoma sp. RP8]|uniref:DUF4815 domain-containing protein n=1 Tax=Spirosoma liriopis TaxID=2937440 RepID=A0ABT0HV69_9BACT|nr:hypothetical protein [Spirosoma liriopis]MCK8496048.1 hypothetical protein [Spirosoma liriopis]
MQDGLHLNNTWVAEVDVSLNFQANDLSKPDTIQLTYSNSFTLPDTMLMRDLTQNAEQIDSGGDYPYIPLDAKLVSEGEVVFYGKAELKSFKGGWSVNLYQTKKALFEVLGEKSLRDLDLSRFDHKWTLAGISALAGAAKGVVYPVVDYGAYDADTFADDAIFPAVYVHTLIEQMFVESGYRPAGNWLQDELIKRLAVPFVDDEANNQDDEWVQARTARVTVGPPGADHPPFYVFTSSRRMEMNPIPFIVDASEDGLWYDGAKNNFRPALKAYVADTAMRLHVQASQRFGVTVSYGAMEAALQIQKNGKIVAESYFSVGGFYNPSGTKPDILSIDEYVTCAPGDQITIRFYAQKRTIVADFTGSVPVDPESSFVTFTPDSAIRPGDTWLVSRNLPELTCADLLVTFALMASSTYEVDEMRKTVRLIPLDSVIANTGQAIDWSSKVEESDEPELAVTLEPYGQRNNVRWKEFDFLSEISTAKISSSNRKRDPLKTLFGDGVITTTAGNLPTVSDLFELEFAACQNSDKEVTGYGSLVLIRTRRVTGKGSERTVERSSTTPRLVLIEPSVTVEVLASMITPDNTIQKNPVRLTGCWWGIRPVAVKTPANNFSLAFDRVFSQREQTLIPRYFSGLKRVLRRPRSLAIPVYLSPEDVATLDLMRPIQIKQVRAGSLVFSNSYFYLNKISGYIPGYVCTATLVPYY